MKKLLLVLVVALFCAGSASATVQGLWLMDEGAGNTASDTSGNGADLTLSYGAGNWVSGHPTFGTGFSFSGTQRLTAAVPGGGFAFDMSQDFTFSATIQTVSDGTIMARTRNEAWEPGAKTFKVLAGKLLFDTGWVGGLSGNTVVNDGLAHEVAVVFDASTAILSLYVDGNLDAQAVDWFGMSSDWGGYDDSIFDFHLGATVNGEVPFFGIMSNVEISNAAIPPSSTLQALWPMDEGAGNTASDTSGNGADLTLSYGTGNWVSGDPTFGTGFSFGGTQRLTALEPVGGFAFDMSGNFTFSVTIQTVNDGCIMSRLDGEAMNPGGKQLLVSGGKLYFDCSFVAGLTGTTLVNDGLAHDIAVEFDALDPTGTNAIVSLYVDGVLDAQSSGWWGMSSDFGGHSDALDFHIGARENLSLPFFGIIGNVQISDVSADNAYAPNPEDNAFNVDPALTVVSWDAVDPNYEYDVYFSTVDNQALVEGRDPSVRIGNRQTAKTAAVSLAEGETYLWLVDSYLPVDVVLDPNKAGGIWLFSTSFSASADNQGEWLLNDAGGTIAADSSGGGNPLYFTGTPGTWGADFFKFDGGNNGALVHPPAPELVGGQTCKMSFSLKTSTGNAGCVISRAAPNVGGKYGTVEIQVGGIYPPNDSTVISLQIADVGILDGTTSVVTNTWHYVDVIYYRHAPDDAEVAIYVDGVLDVSERDSVDATAWYNWTPDIMTGWDFNMGMQVGSKDRSWDGLPTYQEFVGDIKNVQLDPLKAINPNPQNGSEDVSPSVSQVSWDAVDPDYKFDVYFSTNANQSLVANRDPAVRISTSDRQVAKTVAVSLSLGESYVWAVDCYEPNPLDPGNSAADILRSGDLWSFDAVALGSTDLDLDGDVDLEDFARLALQWANTGCTLPGWCSDTDIDRSGTVGLDDLVRMVQDWLWGKQYSLYPTPPQGSSLTPYLISAKDLQDAQGFSIVCLQGLANRDQAQIWLDWQDSDSIWLENFNEIGYDIQPVTVAVGNVPAMLDTGGALEGVASGLLVYDDTAVLGGSQPGTGTTLEAEWLLDDGSGTVALDNTANTNDATLTGTPGWDPNDPYFTFNGSSYFVAPYDASMRLETGSFTVETTIRTSVNDGRIWSRQPVGGWEAGAMELAIVNNAPWFHMSNVGVLQGTANIVDGQWHTIKVVYDRVGGDDNFYASVSIYVDNVLDVFDDAVSWSYYGYGPHAFDYDHDFRIGQSSNPSTMYTGDMKEVRLSTNPNADQGDWSMLVNVFTALAGELDLIPVPVSEAGNWPLPVVIDATDTGSRTAGLWSPAYDNDAAYQWLLTNYPSLKAVGPLVHVHPSTLSIRDYCVANNILPIFYWDGMSATTRTQFDQVLTDTGTNQPVIGMWDTLPEPYGDLDKPRSAYDGTLMGEHVMLRHLSPYAKFFVPTAEQGIPNLTYHSGLPIIHKTFRGKHAAPPVLDNSKIYVAFVLTDGDNLRYVWNGLQSKWADSSRGNVHINWTFASETADLLPGVVSYFNRNASGKDSLISSAGIGYTLLDDYALNFGGSRDNLIREYYAMTDDYMNYLDQDALHLYTDHDMVGTPAVAGGLSELTVASDELDQLGNVKSLLLDYTRRAGLSSYPDFHLNPSGVPILLAVNDGTSGTVPGDPADVLATANEIRAVATPATKPVFLYVSLVWPHWVASEIEALAVELGSDYVLVDAGVLGDLYKQANP